MVCLSLYDRYFGKVFMLGVLADRMDHYWLCVSHGEHPRFCPRTGRKKK